MLEQWAGGCQCGAVRYELSGRPTNPCICHCRMCQKQFGNFFGAFAGVDTADFKLTRGQITYFKSSDDALRGFRTRPNRAEAHDRMEQLSVRPSWFAEHLLGTFRVHQQSRDGLPWLGDVLPALT